MNMKNPLISFALVSLLAACTKKPAPGEENLLEFTPSDCGGGLIVTCDFVHAIAVHGTLDVAIMDFGEDTARTDLRLESSNELALQVTGGPNFTLTALSRPPDGRVTLTALDGLDNEVDHINVRLELPEKLGFVGSNNVSGPEFEAGTGNEIWEVPVDELAFFQVVPKDGTSPGQQLMGKFQYQRVGGAMPGEAVLGGADGSVSVNRMTTDLEGVATYRLSLSTGNIDFTAKVRNKP